MDVFYGPILLYLFAGVAMLWSAWYRSALTGLSTLEKSLGACFYLLFWPAIIGIWFVGGIVALADAIAERFMR